MDILRSRETMNHKLSDNNEIRDDSKWSTRIDLNILDPSKMIIE